MAASFDPKQANLIIHDEGVAIDWAASTDGAFLYGHMGKGWSGQTWAQDALTANASFPASNADQVEFGFVQIARANRFGAWYSGRIASEGSIALNYFAAPALTQSILLDGGSTPPPRDPWYRHPAFSLSGNRRSAETGDHPGLVVRLKLKNRVCSYVPNFLFHVIMDREFWTIFTARENDGKLTYLAYYQWQLVYEFMIRWNNGTPQRFINRSHYQLLKSKTLGRPADADLQAILSHPAGQRANEIGTRAQSLTESGAPPNRSDLKSRFMNVPEIFWA